jgi:hypothetical protein
MIDDDIMFTLRSTFNAILAFITCFLLIANYLPEIIPIMIIIFLPFIFLEVNEKKRMCDFCSCYELCLIYVSIFVLVILRIDCIYYDIVRTSCCLYC